jgi:hypothetical protein
LFCQPLPTRLLIILGIRFAILTSGSPYVILGLAKKGTPIPLAREGHVAQPMKPRLGVSGMPFCLFPETN